jgi:hypothetical protein
MVRGFFLFALVFFSLKAFSQGQYKPKKSKKDFFGGQQKPSRQPSNIGLQLNLGPTFTMASSNKLASSLLSTQSQAGKIGGNFEIGLAHYNMKSPKYSFGRIVDYFDYGLGFKYFRGEEKTTISLVDALGRETGEKVDGLGKMANGYIGARFSVHKLIYIKKTPLYLDNYLGVNGDYLLLQKDQTYANMNPTNQYFSKSLSVNLHYGLGLGIRLKKGSYLMPGVYVPILAFEEFGKEAIHWFSSRYYPLTCQIKWTYLLNKRRSKTSCTTNGSDEDKKKNQEFMQNK